MTRRKVVVIGGGASAEHEVSLASASAVARALDPLHYDVRSLTIDRTGGWHDDTRRVDLPDVVRLLRACDVAVPAVHGSPGEDGTLAAFLDVIGVPWVGSGVHAGAVAMDKWVTKLVARAVGVEVAAGRVVARGQVGQLRQLAWPGPSVVKPVGAGSSLGVSVARSQVELDAALGLAFEFDDRALVEEFVVGREIDVAVLRRADTSILVSPPLEIVGDELFDYATKYGGTADFRVPAHLSDGERRSLEDAARAMFEALGCAGLARVDFFLTPAGPVLNEVNTTPGMTEHSQAPRMFAAGGLAYPALLDELIDGALAR